VQHPRHQAKQRFRLFGGHQTPPGAMPFRESLSDSNRLAGPPFPPSATRLSGHCFGRYRLTARPLSPSAIAVALVLLIFGTLDKFQ